MDLFKTKKDKKLLEYDPKELNMELLSHLQTSLIAKLILVNEEVIMRCRKLTELGRDLPKAKDSREFIALSADHTEKFNAILKDYLSTF